jgi:hypothetical protein
MVDKFLLFVRSAAALPFLMIAAAITMLLVAGLDEDFKPCPNYRYASSKCSSGKTKSCVSKFTKFETFCGQTMQPRVTTCCRVPCGQNETTYFDADGNPDDCYPQAFPQMSLSIGGFILLGIGHFWVLCLWGMCWAVPRTCNLKYVLRGISYDDAQAAAQQVAAKSSAGGEEAIADTTDAGHIEPNPFNMADGEEVQVV